MNLTQLKTLWREHDFRPNKKLGQNFLIDNNVRDNILKNLPVAENDTLIEIGPGFGVMTFEAARLCGKLYAVEKDEKICSIMKPFYEKSANIELICKDVLDVEISSFSKEGGKILILGNLPYYITTPIIEKIIENKKLIRNAYVVVQDELADRIVASPGSRVFGSITCFIQFHANVKKLFKIKKNSFYPRPKVDSCLLAIEVLEEPSVSVKDEKLMFDVIHKCFSQRRKKIINPLSHTNFLGFDRDKWNEIITSCGIDPSSRAEQLSLKDYAKITNTIS